MILRNWKFRYTDRIALEKQLYYRIWYCEDVTAINLDEGRDNDTNRVIDYGFKGETTYDFSENYSDVSSWNSEHHKSYGFASENIVFTQLNNQTAEALLEQAIPSTVKKVNTKSAAYDAYYAFVAEEELRQRQQQNDDLFDDIDDLLEDYYKIAELATQEGK